MGFTRVSTLLTLALHFVFTSDKGETRVLPVTVCCKVKQSVDRSMATLKTFKRALNFVRVYHMVLVESVCNNHYSSCNTVLLLLHVIDIAPLKGKLPPSDSETRSKVSYHPLIVRRESCRALRNSRSMRRNSHSTRHNCA